MAPRQIGGMQEVFLQLKWKSMAGVERTVAAIEKMGGRVLHAYPPSIMVVSVPANKAEKLTGKGGIVAATTERFEGASRAAGNEVLMMAMDAWNAHFSEERRERALASPTLDRAWDTGVELFRRIRRPPCWNNCGNGSDLCYQPLNGQSLARRT